MLCLCSFLSSAGIFDDLGVLIRGRFSLSQGNNMPYEHKNKENLTFMRSSSSCFSFV